MREFQIRLHSVLEVQKFVALATARPFAVTIRDESNQVNGKSFMEMFCLDLRRPLRVIVYCSEEEFERFRNDAEGFLVN